MDAPPHNGCQGIYLSPSTTIIGLDELTPAKGAFKLREHVVHVDCRIEDSPPDSDDLGESYDENDDESELIGSTAHHHSGS
jgi:hypothetical protein